MTGGTVFNSETILNSLLLVFDRWRCLRGVFSFCLNTCKALGLLGLFSLTSLLVTVLHFTNFDPLTCPNRTFRTVRDRLLDVLEYLRWIKAVFLFLRVNVL